MLTARQKAFFKAGLFVRLSKVPADEALQNYWQVDLNSLFKKQDVYGLYFVID